MDGLRSTHQGNERLIDNKNQRVVGEHGGKKAGKCSPANGGRFGDRKNSPINILKRSIRRAWTINVPPGHWTISRKSPAFRIYRSLPLSKKNSSQSTIENKTESNERIKEETEVNNFSVKSESLNGKNKLSSTTTTTVVGKKIDKTIDGKSKYYGERKSNIPIYRRNSREFEDISSQRETTKRSFIPQRYRGSTDDLRKYRTSGDDSTTINSPSQIPKLQLSQKLKDDKLLKRNNNTDKLNIKKDIINKKTSPIIAKKFSKSDINLTSTRLKFNSSQDSLSNDQTDLSYSSNYLKKEKNELTSQIEETKKFHFNMANDKIDIEKVCLKIHEKQDNFNLKNSDELIIDKLPENSLTNFSDNESCKAVNEEIKNLLDAAGQVKKSDDIQQVISRKYSKEEFSNTDDTDDAPNRRSSSHLSPEASPLSTRSSRYSPRESESEPTPALPRKTSSGDSCISSQRIRDAITRTRRESNSSTRYESSGSESIRLSESGLHSYVDLARKVRLFGNSYCCPGASIDESIQRDSATTSAGEDEPHEDNLSRDSGRVSNIGNQGRTILRRRRQFDSQVNNVIIY